MNPREPAERPSRARSRRRKAAEFSVESTGDAHQSGNKIAIAHTGRGDIIISIGELHITVDVPALLGSRHGIASAASIPRTLPRDITGFIGRNDELEALAGAIGQAARTGRPVIIYAIEGMAGVGKTALAIHAAHRLTAQFPDGQLFLRLHAHTPGTKTVEPGDALTALLREIGMDPREIPDSLQEKEALWRDRLSGKRLLLLLDDADSHDQLRPLIPGAGNSAVLVTSRRRLEEFGGDVRVELDVLPVEQAIQLFTQLAGRDDDGSGAIAELVKLAGRLPLAVRILAGRLRSRPNWEVDNLVGELAAARDRSAEIGATDQPVSAAFDLSYNPLPMERKQFFRSLGLNPGTDIDTYAAAAVAGVHLDQACKHLDLLYADHLIDEPTRGRYRFHDLISDYARALATTDPVADQNAAIGRLLDYYLHTAQIASHFLARTPPLDFVAAFTAPSHVPDISARMQATLWMEAERANLQTISEYSSREKPRHAIAITAGMADFLLTAGYWDQAAIVHNTALTAARGTGDQLGEAVTLQCLGTLQRVMGGYGPAIESLTRALELYSAVDDRLGQANVLTNLGPVQDLRGNHAEAAASYARALELYRAVGNRHGEANALINLSIVQDRRGDHVAAAATLSQARVMQRACSDQVGEATALANLGASQSLTGEYAKAAASYSEALILYRVLGDRHGEADVLSNLGIVQDRRGEYPPATTSLTEALELHRTLGDKVGEAYALTNLGDVQRHQGEYASARKTLTKALELCRSLDDQDAEAYALSSLGDVQRLMGEHAAASETLTKALEIFSSFGNKHGQAECLNNLGDLCLESSPGSQTQTFYEQALTIAREVTSTFEEARALEGLGQCHLGSDHRAQADTMLRQALALYQQVGSPRAHELEANLLGFGTS